MMKQQQVFLIEKEEILNIVRQECADIVLESNRLLQAKRELSQQQSQINEIIAELSQRSLFNTPLRPTRSNANSNTRGSSDEREHHADTSNPSGTKAPPSPFPNVLETSVTSLGSIQSTSTPVHFSERMRSTTTPPTRNHSTPTARGGVTNTSLMRDSANTFNSGVQSSTGSASSISVPPVIYPEMLSPEVTKVLVEEIAKRNPQQFNPK